MLQLGRYEFQVEVKTPEDFTQVHLNNTPPSRKVVSHEAATLQSPSVTAEGIRLLQGLSTIENEWVNQALLSFHS